MAIRIKDLSKTLSGKFDIYTRSQYKLLSLAHAGTINGLLVVIEPKDNKRKHNFKHQPISSNNSDPGYKQYYYLGMTDNVVAPYVTMVYSDGTNTVGRVIYADNTRIAHSLLRGLNEVSRRMQTMIKVLDIVKRLQQVRSGSSELCLYMTTLIIPSRNKNELDQVIGSMFTCITAVTKVSQDGYRNGDNLRLVDHNGWPVRILGTIAKIEIIVNQVKLKIYDSQGISHPHIHTVLTTTSELASGPSCRISFYYWSNKNSNTVPSRKALNFKEAHSKNQVDSDDSTSVVAEVTKYATRPTMYRLLPTIKDSNGLTLGDQFKLEISYGVFKIIEGR